MSTAMLAQSEKNKIEADKIARYLRLEDGKPFLAKIADRLNRCQSSLQGNSEVIEIGRSQGRIDILNWILSLKED